MVTSSHSPDDLTGGVPEAERRPIHLRAFSPPPKARKGGGGGSKPSHYVLVFDTETYPDHAQRFRFGTFQFRRGGTLMWKGLFFDPDAVDEIERAELEAYRRQHDVKLLTKAEWIERIFFKSAYFTEATIVGFNLPFDISRISIDHGTARAVRRRDKTVDRTMVGGFTFKLSPKETRPNIRVRQLSRKAAFINFASPAQNPEGDAVKRGHFLDLKTLGDALTGEAFSLSRLAQHLGVKPKGDFSDFARKIDAEFIDYAMDDAEVTWQCYRRLQEQYESHGLKSTPSTKIYSGASLGKAYLKAMKIKPWTSAQPGFDPERLGEIVSTYYGGRAEVHRRREIVRTIYCDFASMYPTVCSLMGLWRFVIADGIEEEDATAAVRETLAGVGVGDVQSPAFWAGLQVIVQVSPDADILPVRAAYGPDKTATIGLNYLSSDRPIWFTLADCIASKLLTGKAPEVVEAIRFKPKEMQEGLRPVDIAGRANYRVDPVAEDFFRRLVDLRRDIRRTQSSANSREDADRLMAEQLAIKIIANATSYGIFIELNVEDRDGKEDVSVFGAEGEIIAASAKLERPGSFFHPLLATAICGAARLMLATTERLLIDAGLDWAFCDTDSMAFAMPEGMIPEVFQQRVEEVCSWFEPLNPYTDKGSILEIEAQNRPLTKAEKGETRFEPLYCYTVSAKRYALFNVGDMGEIIIRKASAHGLGHLLPPYNETGGAPDADAPTDGRESGVRLWQEDIWRGIVEAAQAGTRDMTSRLRPELRQPAASRHAATTPALLRGLKPYNEHVPEPDRIRPFGFMLWLHAKRRQDRPAEEPGAPWDPRAPELKPTAAYVRNLAQLGRVFDRETGDDIGRKELWTYADILRHYHLHPETKFLGGGWTGFGRLRRRHVHVDAIIYIGKEADRAEEVEEFGEEEDTVIVYGAPPLSRDEMLAVIAKPEVRALKREASVGHDVIRQARDRDASIPLATVVKLYRAAMRVEQRKRDAMVRQELLVIFARGLADDLSIAELSRRLPYDASNLSKLLIGKIQPSARVLDRIEQLRAELSDDQFARIRPS